MTSRARPRGNTESWTPIQLAHVETAARRRHDARMHRLASVCVALVLSACSSAPPQRVISSRDVVAEGGAVVSVDVIASRVGAEILAKGGNAVDAAIATAFALAVTWPEAGNLGGGGFMLVRMADGEKAFIDYREIAPAAATPTMFLDADGNVDPVRVRLGYTPVGVPGTVAGLAEAHERFGSLDWAELVEPAYELARDGIPISDALASSIEAEQAELALDPEARRIFLLEDGTHRRAGMRLVQSDLAESLRQIADEGPDAFYRGAIAERICADAQARGGRLTQDDFARYEARVREPLGASYRDHVILAGPPPTSGGFVLVSALRQLEGFDLKALGAGSGEELHLIGETLRRAFLDRALWFADPDFVPVPVSDLLAEDHIDALRASIEQNASTFSDELAGDLDGTLIVDESEQTTHFSVVDSAGNAVANTYTLEESWGAKFVAAGTGIVMNNELHDFNPQPGISTTNGRVGTPPNTIAPGKRPLSSMCPVLVFGPDGRLKLVAGSPGGRTIPSTVLRVVTGVIDHGLSPRAAIDLARVHHQLFPDELVLEESHARTAHAKLESLGHVMRSAKRIGDAHCIGWDPLLKRYVASADTRRAGSAAGVVPVEE